MALVLKDRVQETTTVTGDSPAVLLGAIPGYQTFAASTPNASVVYYTIAGGTEWEVGYGTYYTNNNSVVRVTSQVYSSSNAGAIVDFSAGTKNIFVTYPAEQAVYQEVDGSLKLIGGIIEVSLDGTESANALPNVAFQAFSTIDSYMQSNMQNLGSGNFASADYVVTADDGTDTDNYLDMGMGSSGYNYPEYSGTGPHDGYLMNTGRNLVLLSGKYGANVTAANASSTDIVFVAGDLLADGERGRIKGSTGSVILSNTPNPTDTGEKLQVTGNVAITGNTTVTGAVFATANVTASNQLATKAYVDQNVSTGFDIHTPVRLEQGSPLTATYNNGASGVGANLTNSGTQIALVVSGVTANVADRILVYGQANAVQNGVYVVTDTGSNSTNWILTRSSDTDTYGLANSASLGAGSYFYVTSGTAAGESYVCTTQGTITFGVTPIVFTQFSGATAYTGVSPINVSGQTISLGGVVDATHGGTGLSTYNTGDLIYSNAGNSLTNLTIGSTGQTLIVSGGTPTWGALDMAGSGVSGTLPANHGGTGFASYTIGELLYANASTTLAKITPNNTTTQKVLTQTGNGTTVTSTAWNQLSAGDITGLGTMATQNASSVAITGGSVNGTLIGNATPSSGAFTTLSASSNVSGTGFANYLNAPPSIGGVTPNTGAFTTLNASGALTASANVVTSQLTGFLYGNNSSPVTASNTIPSTVITGLGTMSTQNANNVTITGGTINNVSLSNITYGGLGTMATQNANNVAITGGAINGVTIGNTGASTGAFTTLSASSTVSGTGFSTYLNAPPSIGGVTANTGAFTSLTASSTASFGAGLYFYGTAPGITLGSANVSTGSCAIEIGGGRTGNGYAYTDFVGDATYTDFGFRIIRGNTGPNTTSQLIHRGTGAVYLTAQDAGNVIFATTNIERVRVVSGGNVGIGNTNPQSLLTVAGAIESTTGGVKFPDGTTQTSAASNPYVSGSNSAIVSFNTNITSNATIAAGTNGFSVGPVTTANGVTVTISSGQSWVVI